MRCANGLERLSASKSSSNISSHSSTLSSKSCVLNINNNHNVVASPYEVVGRQQRIGTRHQVAEARLGLASSTRQAPSARTYLLVVGTHTIIISSLKQCNGKQLHISSSSNRRTPSTCSSEAEEHSRVLSRSPFSLQVADPDDLDPWTRP